MTDDAHYDAEENDAFVDFLRRHGEAYNPPPETPVEGIWEGIREARERPGGARVTPIGPHRWLLPVLAVAAVLLLGIMLGRISMRQATERQGPAGPAVATRAEPESERPTRDATPPTGSREDSAPAPAGSSELATASPSPAEDRPRADRPSGPDRPAARPDGPARPDDLVPPDGPVRPTGPVPPDRAGDLYRLASVQMLAQAEALLVDYRSGRAAGRDDAGEIGRWARDVLASTRLLLGSPAARDPATRGLLEDLELVLAQIVHHAGADPIEGEMIDRSIEERDLIPRLRTAIPSGDAASL